jgi:hypothetical protein
MGNWNRSTVSVASGLAIATASTISGTWGVTGEDISGLNGTALLVGIGDLRQRLLDCRGC